MRTNHVKTRLAAREVVRGIWVSLPSPETVRLLARLPADWLLIDAEHSPLDIGTLTACVAAIADAAGPAPLVRVAAGSVENIKHALDAGAAGIIAPMVNTRAEAEAVVAASRFPPQGARSFGSMWAPLAWDTTPAAYLREANNAILVGVQIENVAAVKNLDAILSTPGIDLAFIGPIDLAISMGLDPFAPEPAEVFVRALAYIQQAAARHNLPTGIYCATGRVAAERVAQGFHFVNAGSDVGALQRGLAAELDASRAAP
ncbi:MAG TPA: aldolase/citrate lyase family protein [Chloroflexia bacterium]|nr:aldolase/citrate lyase family protein [Chloroflexia bacterium]